MDRLTSLTAFVRVVDSGGFSAAGRRLNMSTAMISNHVHALEERLGVRLLNRTMRKVDYQARRNNLFHLLRIIPGPARDYVEAARGDLAS